MKITRVVFIALTISLFVLVCQFGCGKEKETQPKEQQTEIQKPIDISMIPKEMLEALHGVSQKNQGEGMAGPKRPLQKMPGIVKVPNKIVIPKEVEGKWKAIVVEVTDKKVGETKEYTLDLKGHFTIPDTGLKVHVQNFLPDFSMSSQGITSFSDEPKNPAARVAISEGGKVIFEGWLFKLYPKVHAFQHPRYSIILKNHIRADLVVGKTR
ncbi:MAG TPA: DUF2155 domain-containing protein [Syntrophaceae bacterium]|nr:DUF2155 domain-containing protein [Syntrophaceae bacterium]